MNLFQYVTLSALALLLAREIRGFWRHTVVHPMRWLRTAVWLAAGVAIAWPEQTTTRLANYLGIGHGANLVLYLFVLAFLGVTFYFYSRQVRLQRQITQLVRHLAIQEARPGAGLDR
jgi:hypothetical protein